MPLSSIIKTNERRKASEVPCENSIRIFDNDKTPAPVTKGITTH
jgi:hypothetical protein